MTVWRPASRIAVKALGLHWRAGALLASDVCDDTGAVKGVRPLGGSVELGETWDQTLVREFQEELGIAVTPVGAMFVMENIYEHYGQMGHEILFISDLEFPRGAFAGQDVIHYSEDNGARCTARWHPLADLRAGSVPLFPDRLLDRLTR